MVFEGIRPVLHVPFAAGAEQSLRLEELRALARRMLDTGVDGLVALGLASEAWAIREVERDEITAAVAEVCAGRRPFVVGLDGTTAVAIDRGRRAARAGAAGLMVLPPARARSTDQLVRHFSAIADAAGIAILVQDSPQVTQVTLEVDTIVALARAHPLVRSLKMEAPGAGTKMSALVAEGIEVVAGWGGLHYLENIRRGAVGCMPGCDLGPAILMIDRRARAGDWAGAEELYQVIQPLLAYEAQSLDLLLLGAKRLLKRQAVFGSAALRAPARELDPHEAASLDRLFEVLEAAGIPGFSSVVA